MTGMNLAPQRCRGSLGRVLDSIPKSTANGCLDAYLELTSVRHSNSAMKMSEGVCFGPESTNTVDGDLPQQPSMPY
jgi:hypothetical protein